MKIKNKILLIFILFIFVIITISLSISMFLRYNYIDIKYSIATNYFINNDISVDDYADYLLNKGYVVTGTKLDTYKNYGSATCPYEENPIVVYDENNEPILYAVINENIVNDNLLFINYILLIITILILLLLSIVYLLINKVVIQRIDNLVGKVGEYDNDSLENIITNLNLDGYNDEITTLEKEFKKLLTNIKNNEHNKHMLVMALSHELKSPITKIEAILNMYEGDVEGYNQKTAVINMVLNETEYMNSNINNLLEFYKTYNEFGTVGITNVNINEIINKSFSDDCILNSNLKINIVENAELILKVNPDKFEIILNNIKNNIVKHSKANTSILIEINNNGVIFENKIGNISSTSTKVGNIINDFLATDMKIKNTTEIVDDKYIVKLSIID